MLSTLFLHDPQQPHGFLPDVKVTASVTYLLFLPHNPHLPTVMSACLEPHAFQEYSISPTHVLACFDPAHFTYRVDLHRTLKGPSAALHHDCSTERTLSVQQTCYCAWQALSSARNTMQSDPSVSCRKQNSGRSWRVRPGAMWVAMLQVVLAHARQRGPREGRNELDACSPRFLCGCCGFETNSRCASRGQRQGRVKSPDARRKQLRSRHVGSCSCARLQGTAGRHRAALTFLTLSRQRQGPRGVPPRSQAHGSLVGDGPETERSPHCAEVSHNTWCGSRGRYCATLICHFLCSPVIYQ